LTGLIRLFKNEQKAKVVVAVDLLTTGIDVPAICNLVFLRRVKSRVLYEQMIGRATRQCPEIEKETFRIFDAVGLYDALESVTEMKPVVTNPLVSLRALLEQLEEAVAQVEDVQVKERLVEEILGKLQRKKRSLKGEALETFQAVAGQTPTELAKELKQRSPEAVPGDYLDEFEAYIRDNLNHVPALEAVVQRPRDLTRKDLKELALLLSEKGFTETNLRTRPPARRFARDDLGRPGELAG
jgi:type I restriction enzyme, R subunit